MRFHVTAGAPLAAMLALGGCGAPQPADRPPAGAEAFAAARAEWEEAARDCTIRGDHLGASRYLEAALAAGGDEERLLTLLAAAQIRAGRLRAARESIAWLETVAPGRPGLSELGVLLDSFLDPSAPAAREREAGGVR
jgi:hypothetical protein